MPAKKWSDKLKEAEKAPSFKELEEGSYSFVINDAGKVGEYNGVEQISINPAVDSGPRTGSRLFHNFNFPDDNPKVLRIVFEQLQALGISEDYLSRDPEPTMEEVSQSLKGRRFTADVVHSKSQDGAKTFVNLRNFKPAVSPSAMAGPGAAPAGPGGPGMAAPAGPGAPQYAPPAPAAPAPQQYQQAPSNDPWGGQQQQQQQTQPQAPVGGPWDNTASQQYQQAPAQQAPVVQQQQQPQQTWQAPPVPPLS